jgi:hypothetical protein
MKQVQILVLLLFIFSTLKAQDDHLSIQGDSAQLINLLRQNKIHLNGKNTPTFGNEFLAFNTEKKPKYLYETDLGKVYAMPPDNMPCLKPNFHSRMPVDKTAPSFSMPNPLKEYK